MWLERVERLRDQLNDDHGHYAGARSCFVYGDREQPLGAFASLPNGYTFLASTPFTDNSTVQYSTVVKAEHVLELRNTIAALWSAASLGTPHWTNVVSAGIIVRTTDVREMRISLSQGLTALGYSTSSFTADPLAALSHCDQEGSHQRATK